jgi:hypothetical protein
LDFPHSSIETTQWSPERQVQAQKNEESPIKETTIKPYTNVAANVKTTGVVYEDISKKVEKKKS